MVESRAVETAGDPWPLLVSMKGAYLQGQTEVLPIDKQFGSH